MAHFEAVVGDVGPASSFERRHAFLTAGPEMVDVPPAAAACASSAAPATATTTRTCQGGQRHRPGDRAGAVGRPGARRLAAEAAARPGPERRPGGDDQRGAVAVALQPQRPRLRRLGPGRDPHRTRAKAAAAGAADERRVADRPDARDRRSTAASRCGPRRRSTTSSSRTAASSACARCATARPCAVRARQGVLISAGGFAHNPRDARGVRRRPAEPGASGRSPTPATPARRCSTAMRLGAADRPDGRGVVAAVAADRPLRPVDARPGPPAAAHDLRRRRRATGSSTSRTRTWRSARRCTPATRRAGPCRAG